MSIDNPTMESLADRWAKDCDRWAKDHANFEEQFALLSAQWVKNRADFEAQFALLSAQSQSLSKPINRSQLPRDPSNSGDRGGGNLHLQVYDEYFCDSCTADCSRERYHCPKLEDFDLCIECYNNGMFGPGMAPSDFILMGFVVFPTLEYSGDNQSSNTKVRSSEHLLLADAHQVFDDSTPRYICPKEEAELQTQEGTPKNAVGQGVEVIAESFDTVTIASEGGSLHEPAPVGFVEERMCAVAIWGNVLTPPIDSILAVTILEHKVVGAASTAGLTLAKTVAEAKHTFRSMGTMCVALSTGITSDCVGHQLILHVVPGSLKQVSKLSRTDEFDDSVAWVLEELTVGTMSEFIVPILEKLFSSSEYEFTSVVAENFTGNLVTGFYPCGGSNLPFDPGGTSEEGGLLPSDSETWQSKQSKQSLEQRSSAKLRPEEAFFNLVEVLPQASLFVLVNAKKNAIYAVHVDYGHFSAATRLDYMADFTITMPILSLTGTSDNLPNGEHVLQVYYIQTQAIQQYALDLYQCLPPPGDTLLGRDYGVCVFDTSISEGFAMFELSYGPPNVLTTKGSKLEGPLTDGGLSTSSIYVILSNAEFIHGLMALFALTSGAYKLSSSIKMDGDSVEIEGREFGDSVERANHDSIEAAISDNKTVADLLYGMECRYEALRQANKDAYPNSSSYWNEVGVIICCPTQELVILAQVMFMDFLKHHSQNIGLEVDSVSQRMVAYKSVEEKKMLTDTVARLIDHLQNATGFINNGWLWLIIHGDDRISTANLEKGTKLIFKQWHKKGPTVVFSDNQTKEAEDFTESIFKNTSVDIDDGRPKAKKEILSCPDAAYDTSVVDWIFLYI